MKKLHITIESMNRYNKISKKRGTMSFERPTQIPGAPNGTVSIPATVTSIEKKLLPIIKPQTKEDVLKSFLKTKKTHIYAPKPKYLIKHDAGGEECPLVLL